MSYERSTKSPPAEILSNAAAAELMRRLLASYPSANPIDPKGYVLEMSGILLRFPANVAREAVSKIQKSLRFPPTIAEMFEACEHMLEHEQRMARFAAMPPVTRRGYVKPEGAATYSALCERYGVSAVPSGWDAVDMAQAFAKHGADLRQHIEDVVAHGPTTKSLFARIVDRLRLSSTDDELRAHYSHVDAAAE